MGSSRRGGAARMQPPLHSLWKQFLLGPGQRARQPAYLGAHCELFTYLLGPQRLYRAIRCRHCQCIFDQGAGRDPRRTARDVARLAIAFFAAPESCRRSILVAAGAEPDTGAERGASRREAPGPQRQPMPVAGVARAAPTSGCCHRCVPSLANTHEAAMGAALCPEPSSDNRVMRHT